MSDRPRFTISITITDNQGLDRYTHAIGCDLALRISHRAIEDLKAGPHLGISLVGMDETVKMMRTREMRRDLLLEAAVQLAEQMADRMEDAEGWHDSSRIEPARKALGGSWQ